MSTWSFLNLKSWLELINVSYHKDKSKNNKVNINHDNKATG